MAERAGENLRGAVELMDQTDEGERLVKMLVRLIEEERLKVRVYTKGQAARQGLHLRLQTSTPKGHESSRQPGEAIVGSSNFTLSGHHPQHRAERGRQRQREPRRSSGSGSRSCGTKRRTSTRR